MTTDAIELASFFDQAECDERTYQSFADAAHVSFQARERFTHLALAYRDKLEMGQGDPLRVALALLILGQFAEALNFFGRAPASPLRHYHAAEAALGLNRFDEALREFEQAARAGWDSREIDLRCAETLVRKGDLPAADKLLKRHESTAASHAPWHHVAGIIAEAQGDRAAAGVAYERALAIDPEHVPTLFRCARLYDQCGEEEGALGLYDRLAQHPRAHVNALINAAVLYEERGRYDEAAWCLRRVLKAFPNHTRARLFLKSVESCREMVLEEPGAAPVDARTRLLTTPITEFELSVRARNCLKKMNVRTLGDLIHLNEQELLAYKNFGETSLAEIRALLTKKGLRLGMEPEEIDVEPVAEVPAAPPKPVLPPGQEAILSRPVSELELSVRARRCLQRLNVRTLGDLCQLTEAELLATRNFGVTSLNEVKARLTENGLKLAVK